MPGMNSGLDANDPVVVAAFRTALIHQGIIALLIFGLISAVWAAGRARPRPRRRSPACSPVPRSKRCAHRPGCLTAGSW